MSNRAHLSCPRVVRVKHVIQHAPDVCYLRGREFRSELCETVGGFVDECVEGFARRVLGFLGADFEVVGFELRVDELEGLGEYGWGYVAGGPGAVGVWWGEGC